MEPLAVYPNDHVDVGDDVVRELVGAYVREPRIGHFVEVSNG